MSYVAAYSRPGRAPGLRPAPLGQLQLPNCEPLTDDMRAVVADASRGFLMVGTGIAVGAAAGLVGGLTGRWWAGLLIGAVGGGLLARAGSVAVNQAMREPAGPARGLSGVLAVM
jgi:hypothetical protein